MLMMYALSRTVVHKLCRGELASTVGVKCLQLEVGLVLHPHLDVLDGSQGRSQPSRPPGSGHFLMGSLVH
jgi:hypothetical protein